MAARPKAGKATGWVAGAVVLALGMAGGAWALAISPVREETATALSDAQSIRDSNDILRARIATLRSQFAQLDDYKAELAALRIQIPTEAQLSAYLREVSAQADLHAVTAVDISVELGQSLVPVSAPAATAPAADADDQEAEESVTASEEPDEAPPAPAAPSILEGFVGIPVSLTIVGEYPRVVAFLASLQRDTARLFLVTSFNAMALDESEASGGRPPTVVGDMELRVSGVIFVLQADALGPTEEPEVPVEPSPMPAAVPDKNPLIPVGTPAV